MSCMEKAAYNLAQKNAIAISSTLAGNFPEGVIQDVDLDPLGIRTTVANNSTSINNKIKSMTYTASTNGVTNIVHNLNYVPTTDELSVIDTGYGSVLTEGIEYTNSIDDKSINLIDWSISQNESIKFTLFKNIK